MDGARASPRGWKVPVWLAECRAGGGTCVLGCDSGRTDAALASPLAELREDLTTGLSWLPSHCPGTERGSAVGLPVGASCF